MQLHGNRDITDLTSRRDPYFDNMVSSSEEFNIRTNNGEARLGLDYDKDNSLIRMFLKYKTVGKRKLFWYLWEDNSKRYSSYSEFKQDWDPKTSISSTVWRDIKSDLSKEIDDLLRMEDPFKMVVELITIIDQEYVVVKI